MNCTTLRNYMVMWCSGAGRGPNRWWTSLQTPAKRPPCGIRTTIPHVRDPKVWDQRHIIKRVGRAGRGCSVWKSRTPLPVPAPSAHI